jgi:hypothetical protein
VREFVNIRQVPGEPRRRWFFSDEFDLILWFGEDGGFAGFELCYDKSGVERSISWRPDSGFEHMAVDAGEDRSGKHKAAPIMVMDRRFNAMRVLSTLVDECRSIPPEIAAYVVRTLETHPSYRQKSWPLLKERRC